MSKALPSRWARRLVARGFTDPRFKHDVASMGALSAATGLHTSTISALISGKRKPTVETVRLLTRELGDDVADWLGVPLREPYVPPAEADLLTPRQRKALTEMIRAMVPAEQEGGGAHGNAAPNKPPAPGPADQPGDVVRRLPKGGSKPPLYSFDDEEEAARNEDNEPPRLGDDL